MSLTPICTATIALALLHTSANASPPQLTPARLETLWADLGHFEPAPAFRAAAALVNSPADAVPFLAACLKPVAPADPKAIAGWLADLTSPKFAVTVKAQQELERLGELAVAALREYLKNPPTFSAMRYATRLVEKAEAADPPPELRRDLLAVEVLVFIGTDEARAVLNRLAAGATGHRLTREARLALK